MLCQNCKVASQIAFTFCIDVFTGHFHKSFLYAIFKIIHLLSEEFLLFCVIKSPLYTPACFKTDIGSTTADSTAVDYQTWVIHSGVAGFYHGGGGGGVKARGASSFAKNRLERCGRRRLGFRGQSLEILRVFRRSRI